MSNPPAGQHSSISTTGSAAVGEFLSAYGVRHEIVEHDPTSSAAAEAHATGEPLSRVAKTVVLQDQTGYVLALVPASERVDLHKVRDVLGATRSLRLAGEREIESDFPMFEVGATPPVGPMLPRAELVDRRLADEDRILCAGGDHRHSVVIDSRDLVRLTDATVADICKD